MSETSHPEPGQWPVLLSLPAHDPERRAADLHADACAECSAGRGRARALLTQLQSIPLPPAPAAAALKRAFASVDQALEAEAFSRRRSIRWQMAAMGLGFGVLVLAAHHPTGGFTNWVMALALLWIAAVVPVAVRLWHRGGLWLLALTVPFAAWRISGQNYWPRGVDCALSELFAAALPLLALAFVARRRDAVLGPLPFAAAAGAGALGGQAALLLTCPSTDAAHLLVFHAGTVLLAAVLGAVLARGLGWTAVLRRA